MTVATSFDRHEKQGLCRTRKLRQCTNLKENLRICELAKASNRNNWSVQLVCLAGPFSWPVQQVCPVGLTSRPIYTLHLTQ